MFNLKLAFILVAGCCNLLAQEVRQPALEETIYKTGLRVQPFTERARASDELRLRLLTAQAPEAHVTAQEIQRIRHDGPPPRQRSGEISRDHLLVVVLDSQQTVRYWQIVIDPRLVRGEFPDAAGNLHKTEFHRPDAELKVFIPEGVDAAEVRILTPAWLSGELALTSLASVTLSSGGRQ